MMKSPDSMRKAGSEESAMSPPENTACYSEIKVPLVSEQNIAPHFNILCHTDILKNTIYCYLLLPKAFTA